MRVAVPMPKVHSLPAVSTAKDYQEPGTDVRFWDKIDCRAGRSIWTKTQQNQISNENVTHNIARHNQIYGYGTIPFSVSLVKDNYEIRQFSSYPHLRWKRKDTSNSSPHSGHSLVIKINPSWYISLWYFFQKTELQSSEQSLDALLLAVNNSLHTSQTGK